MESTIRQWGNSPALRLPKALLKRANFSLEQKVNVTVEAGRIVIAPSAIVEYELDALIAGISVENVHAEFDFGQPVGKETS